MGALRSLDLELEATTPLWIGGSDQRPELRPPSVRGCMRFWYRALVGGVLGEDLDLLRQAETAVYGGTKLASSVAVRMRGKVRTAAAVVEPEQTLPGLDYMFWSVFQRRRDAIVPGERFWLRLQTRPFPLTVGEVAGRTLTLEDRFALAAASLWLLIRLGGVGARARRAGGGMRVVGTPGGWPENLPALATAAATPEQLAAELLDGLRRVRQATRWQGPPPASPSSYDILHERVCQLHVVNRAFASWWEAVNWAGEKFLAFRIEQRSDAGAVAALLTRGQLAGRTIQRAVLGLPLGFFFKSIFADLTARGVPPPEARRKASATVVPTRGQARSSPLFFRVIQLAGEPARYAILMGLFRSRLLPDDEMTVRPNDHSIRPERVSVPPDYSLLDKWFDYVWAQEVELQAVALT